MAAYAALLSLFHTLNHINNHPRPPISLDQNQVDSLTQNFTFLLDFLERHSSEDDEDLESRIAAAAYAAEDVIESNIVHQIHAGSTSDGINICPVDLHQGLERAIRNMDLITKEVTKIVKEKIEGSKHHLLTNFSPSTGAAATGKKLMGQQCNIQIIPIVGMRGIGESTLANFFYPNPHILHRIHAGFKCHGVNIQEKITRSQDQDLHKNSSVSTALGGSASTWQSSTMPVFDDAMITQILDKLTGQQSGLQIIPIVGMGGIGKTTFATNMYSNQLIAQHFDILAWVTVSQGYSRGNILQLLCQEVKGNNNDLSEDKIGEILYKHLWGRRYLIVMDDIWTVDAWDKVKSFLPDNNNGSRIMITTRLSNLAFELSACHIFQMQFLNEDKSWYLLCEIVFGKLHCPIELENTGKEIASKCRGLPLSIAVIGGLLRKSNMTRAYWIYTLENLNSLINLENDEYTLRILRTSYKELPMHLKPCFLYMGIFPEDNEIKTSVLIKLWVAEGVLRPNDDKSLEEVAKEYLKELIDRNLILIPELRWDGEARFCKIHDLLRDVCLREAQKQKFFCVVRQQKHHTPQGIDMERRICIDPGNTSEEYSPQFLHAVESALLARSLLYKMHAYDNRKEASPSLRFGLLRVYSAVDKYRSTDTYHDNAIFEQANLRYLSLKLDFQDAAPRFLCLWSLLWNLQTLKLDGLHCLCPIIASEIWEMPLLRHVTLYRFALPDPPEGEDNIVLENLQTLSTVLNLKFSEEVVKRIPNIKKLKVIYESTEVDEEEGLTDFCLNNLGRLQKLESLEFDFAFRLNIDLENVRRNLVSFPHSLKKLTLHGTKLMSWKELTTRIGSLPLLQVLRLYRDACFGTMWETVEGQFCSLRFLQIVSCEDLKYWEMEGAYFPRLEYLCLRFLKNLEEIPWCIGDIPTLKSILVEYCNKTVAESAKRIKEEREENGNEDIQVVIDSYSDKEDVDFLFG